MATADELRALSAPELDDRVRELRRSIFDMRNKHGTGVLDSTAALEAARRDVARCLTVKREKELGLARRAGTAPEKKGE